MSSSIHIDASFRENNNWNIEKVCTLRDRLEDGSILHFDTSIDAETIKKFIQILSHTHSSKRPRQVFLDVTDMTGSIDTISEVSGRKLLPCRFSASKDQIVGDNLLGLIGQYGSLEDAVFLGRAELACGCHQERFFHGTFHDRVKDAEEYVEKTIDKRTGMVKPVLPELLPFLKHVKDIDLSDYTITKTTLETLLERCPNLEKLDFPGRITPAAMALLPRFTHLKDLSLLAAKICNEDLTGERPLTDNDITMLRDCQTLTSLNISYTGITAASLNILSEGMIALKVSQLKLADADIPKLARFSKLITLDLSLNF